jgi:hypothetical protein
VTNFGHPNQSKWGEIEWNLDQPVGSNSLLQVYHSSSTACDTLVPDAALPGNSSGFTKNQSPLRIDTLSTTTYNRLCIREAMDTGTATSGIPALLDWAVRWKVTPQFTESAYRWYANNNTLTPTDPWPVGGDDVNQNEAISSEFVVRYGDVLRLRMALTATNTNAAIGSVSLKLQYAATSSCAAAETWYDVAPTSSSTAPWRGYNNSAVADATTLPSTLLSGSTVAETYE